MLIRIFLREEMLKMKTKPIIDIEKALSEKRQMQKIFIRDNGYSSSVLTLIITWLEERKEKK